MQELKSYGPQLRGDCMMFLLALISEIAGLALAADPTGNSDPHQIQAVTELVKAIKSLSPPGSGDKKLFFEILGAVGTFISNAGWPLVGLIAILGVWSRDEVVRVDLEGCRVLCPGLADGLERGSPL